MIDACAELLAIQEAQAALKIIQTVLNNFVAALEDTKVVVEE